MEKMGGLGTMMSGSGPTIFTLCQSREQAEEIKNIIVKTFQDPNLELFISKLSSNGINNIKS